MAHQARKRFGQHFLTDESIIHAIVSTIHPGKDDFIIEIGPGLGAITYPLMSLTQGLEVVEIDRDLVNFWKQKCIPELVIHQADALAFDFLSWSQTCLNSIKNQQTLGQVKVIGNLPYNISTPLLFHLMKAIDSVDVQVFMLQKEVIQRMVALPGDSEYSRLSVMLQMRYEMLDCFDVPPNSFEPPPKVNSAVVVMRPKKNTDIDAKVWSVLESLVAKAFSQRRKVLSNNIGEYRELLQLDATTLRARAQEISGQTYLEWAKMLVKQDQI